MYNITFSQEKREIEIKYYFSVEWTWILTFNTNLSTYYSQFGKTKERKEKLRDWAKKLDNEIVENKIKLLNMQISKRKIVYN